MENAQRKIKTTSTILIVVLSTLITIIVALNILIQIDLYSSTIDDPSFSTMPSFWPHQVAPYLQIVVYAYLIYIFFGIKKEQTPFSKVLPMQLKVFAIVFFIVQFLPELTSLLIAITNPEQFVLMVTQVRYLALALVLFTSLMIYSLSLIFQYGIMLQDDSNNIV